MQALHAMKPVLDFFQNAVPVIFLVQTMPSRLCKDAGVSLSAIRGIIVSSLGQTDCAISSVQSCRRWYFTMCNQGCYRQFSWTDYAIFVSAKALVFYYVQSGRIGAACRTPLSFFMTADSATAGVVW